MNRQDLARVVDAKRKDDPYDVFGWSLVSSQHRYIWNILPKNACVTTTITLRQLEGNPHRGEDLWGDAGVLKLKDFPTDAIVEMLTSPQWYRFCFVRNPYDKLFSAYKSKIGGNCDGDPYYLTIQQEIRQLFDYPQRNGERVGIVSFRDFVQYVRDRRRPYDGHWCIQSEKLSTEMVSYDFIGRFETYQRDFQAVLERLGASPAIVASATKVHGQSIKICLPSAYDRELADIVYEIYRADFEAFGYERESWMFQ